MSKLAKISTAIGITLAVVLIGFFSYTSYTHTNVKESRPTVNTEQTKAAAKIPNKNSKSKQHNNIFLQDKNNSDRVIAIHPYGSNGIYQYRKQANGDLYPEYKFFNGNVKYQNKKLTIDPAEGNASSFAISKKSDGTLVDKKSHTEYTKLNVAENSQNSKKLKYTVFKPKQKSTTLDRTKYASINIASSQPQLNKNFKGKYLPAENTEFYLHNGSFFNPYTRIYYGEGFEKFDADDFNPNTPEFEKYNKSSAMYHQDVGNKKLSDEDKRELLAWEAVKKHQMKAIQPNYIINNATYNGFN